LFTLPLILLFAEELSASVCEQDNGIQGTQDSVQLSDTTQIPAVDHPTQVSDGPSPASAGKLS
jgi:hypothetical protein